MCINSKNLALVLALAATCPAVAGAGERGRWDRPGYSTVVEDGRLWIFEEGSKELSSHLRGRELAKHTTRVSAGPNGMTVKAPDADIILGYLAYRPGFATRIDDGRVWVFRDGSDELAQHDAGRELAKHVIRPGVGPGGATVKAPDAATVEEYLTYKDGFTTIYDEGRLWVFEAGSWALADFRKKGEPAKHVIRPGAGPRGMTVKSPDTETIVAYMVAAPGFETIIDDGRIWVFRPDSKDLETFRRIGEPAKHVIRPGAGPMKMTVKAPDTATLQAYLSATRG